MVDTYAQIIACIRPERCSDKRKRRKVGCVAFQLNPWGRMFTLSSWAWSRSWRRFLADLPRPVLRFRFWFQWCWVCQRRSVCGIPRRRRRLGISYGRVPSRQVPCCRCWIALRLLLRNSLRVFVRWKLCWMECCLGWEGPFERLSVLSCIIHLRVESSVRQEVHRPQDFKFRTHPVPSGNYQTSLNRFSVGQNQSVSTNTWSMSFYQDDWTVISKDLVTCDFL